ncbi:hypothetical protein [Tellurirhabdus rosea]|uniref:hypothetical protein n=1 Tax=Tellurirhabdus rosea TaxID=2674997 RepID=UPI00225A0F14|nr:hypothetical protein [Tellurirhabdus rosea]
MKRIYAFILLGWLAIPAVWAQQVKLSENPDQFITDTQKLMNGGGPAAQRAQKNLEGLWTANSLSTGQKERIVSVSRRMNTKRFPVASHFAPFYESVYHLLVTQQSSPADVDNYLSIVDKSVDNLAAKDLSKLFETVRLFGEKRQLYANNYNKLLVNGGSFTFKMAGEAAAAPTDTAGKKGAAPPKADASRFDGWDTPLDSVNKTPLVAVVNRRPIPALAGPVMELKGADLVMVTAGDSVVIQKTDGALGLKDGLFVGKGGTFTWEMAGQPETSVTLADYSFLSSSPRLVADDVTLNYKLLAKPVKGTFEYVYRKRAKGAASEFPRFMSWQNDAVLTNLSKDLDYKGGVALAGPRFYSSSVSKQPAVLTVKKAGKPAFKAISPRFEFSADSVISSPLAEFVGYIDAADSLHHPGVQFHYDRPAGVAKLYRADRTRYANAPYADTYHRFYVQPEALRWDLARNKVDFYIIGAKKEVPLRLESFDYYQPQLYTGMTVDYGFHPLQVAASYISKNKTQTFMAEDLAKMARISPDVMRDIMGRMITDGYVLMDPKTEMMRLSRKGVLYVLANAGKQDYDNFRIDSRYPSNDSLTNATMNLTDKFLLVRGVERFTISDSLKIFAVPSDKTLRIGKNRAFVLNGQLKSGNMRYTGRDLGFNYEQFSMNLSKIDSITFTPKGKNQEIGGDIQYEKPGTVFLADKGNKSGKQKDKKTTQRLVMPEGMTVYFNQPYRGNLLYNKKVYFKVPAVDNDTLGNGDIAFDGTFHSDGIFPPIKTTLKTMPDNSLGFVYKAPAAGLPLYGGKGNVRFKGDLIMDRKGLRAEGVIINHLAASIPATSVLFMTDSLVATGTDGRIKEGVVGKAYFPEVDLNNYTMKWLPGADSMKISTKADHFSFYGGSTNLKGDLTMRSTGLFGRGLVKRPDSETSSENIKFNKEGFLADKAQFRVMAGENQKPMLLGTRVDVDFNQVKSLVSISTDKTAMAIDDTLGSSLEFPSAAYRTSINKAQWDIKAKTIAMKGDVKTSTFTATADEQEGLSFNAGAALYEVEKATLNISGVPYITSADARIYPEKGLVSIKRNGQMQPLKGARLELDTVSLFHKLKNGNIQVLSRTRFSGDATYMFPTSKGDTAAIKMGSFELKEVANPNANAVASRNNRRAGRAQPAMTYYTVATADVDERDNLMLAPRIQYRGTITMLAPEKDLKLDGAIKMALKKRPNLVSDWLPLKDKIGETFTVKVDQNLKNDGNLPLMAGLHFRGGGSTGVYPTFLSVKENDKDEDLIRAMGVMAYDEKDKVYRIVTRGPDGLDDVEGAFTFDDPKGVMTFQGKLGLMNARLGEGQGSFVLASGSGRAQIDSNTVRLNTLAAFAFPLPTPINAAVAEKVVKVNLEEKNDEAAEDDLLRLNSKLTALFGKKVADAYQTKAQNQHVSLTQADPKLIASLVLSNLNLRWADKQNAFYSVGTIGVSNIENTDINAQMEGFVEIRKSDGGDEATIYLEGSPDDWFYWDYKPGQLALVTSDAELNDKIAAFSRTEKTKIPVTTADMAEKQQFVDRFLDTYKTRPKVKPQPKTVVKGAAPAKKEEKKKDKEDTREGF